MTEQLHILGPQYSTFVRSVQLCCEEKQLGYTVGQTIDGETIPMRDKRLYQYHPFGKVPVLIHNGQHYFETTSICRYLDNCFSATPLQPASAADKAEVDQWANCLALYVDQIFIRRYVVEFAFPKGENDTVRQAEVEEVEPEVIRLLNLLDKEMAEKAFFKSDTFSIADAILIPMLDYVERLPHSDRLFSGQTHLLPYLNRMRQRESGKVVLL